MAFDIYAEVTDRIIEQMEKGIVPWRRPWVCTGEHSAISHVTGKPYSLLNQFLLGREGEYLTFKQAQEEGGKVRKGEHGHMVVFWKWIETEEKDEKTGEIKKNAIPFLRYFTVFHIDQCEGIKPRHKVEKPENGAENIEEADRIATDYTEREHIKVNFGSNSAFYSPSSDTVTVPAIEQYSEASEYYSTLFHELVHSTGHTSRLNRLTENAAFGSDSYSKEELVAEIGSCGILTSLGISTDNSFRNNVAYLQSWVKRFKEDKHLIVSAASKAEKAIKYIMGTQGEQA